MAEQGSDQEPDTGLEAQRRQQLMRATMECVAELGVEKTTMWMVAERAGVSTGMVLYYYRNKKELITSAVKLASKDFAHRLFAVTHGAWGMARLRESVEIILSESESVPRNFLIQYRMAALKTLISALQPGRVSAVKPSQTSAGTGRRRSQGSLDAALLADRRPGNGLAAGSCPRRLSPARASRSSDGAKRVCPSPLMYLSGLRYRKRP
jgi:AcrR family transcriptional regulator